MNIVFATPHYKPYFGGIERVIEQLALEFNSKKHTSFILTTKWAFPRQYHPEWSEKESYMESDVYRVATWPHYAPPFFQVPLVWVSRHEVQNRLNEIKPELIILMSDRWFIGNYHVIQWATKNHVPVIFSLSFHTLTRNQRFLKPINYYLTNKATFVHVITELEKKQVYSTYKTELSKMIVIPWGAEDIGYFERNIDRSEFNIISVGRISTHKGQLFLARAYAQTPFTKSSTLTLIGAFEDEDVVKEIRSISIGGDKKIILTGHITDEEMTQKYRDADVFVLTPEYEAFGLVFIEALSRGIPVITHDVGAITSVLAGCESATIIDPYNQDQLTQSLLSYEHLDPDNIKRLEEVSKTFVKGHYTWKNTAEQFLQLIQN